MSILFSKKKEKEKEKHCTDSEIWFNFRYVFLVSNFLLNHVCAPNTCQDQFFLNEDCVLVRLRSKNEAKDNHSSF